jgi:cell division protein FtsB
VYHIYERQRLALELQSDICKKDSELVMLRAELEELERRNLELKEEASQMNKEISFDIGIVGSVDMFIKLFENSSKCIHDFTKLVVSWMGPRLLKVCGR